VSSCLIARAALAAFVAVLLAACAKTATVSTEGDTAAAPAAETAAEPTSDAAPGPPGSGFAGGRPFIVIRFTSSNVDYEKPLAAAIQRARAARSNLAFDLVAVTPQAGSADELADDAARAREQAAAVLKSLNTLGIPADRVNMMTWTGQATDANEIRLYIR